MTTKNQNNLGKFIGLTSIVAGIMHATAVAFSHVAPLPIETVFFVVVGLLQVWIGYLFLTKPSPKTAKYSLILHGGLLVMLFYTRLVSTPFQEGVESWGRSDVIIGIFESIAIIAICFDKSHLGQKVSGQITRYEAVASSFIIILISGAAFIGSSHAMEFVFPDRLGPHGLESHGHNDEADVHEDSEETTETHLDQIETHDEPETETKDDHHDDEDDDH